MSPFAAQTTLVTTGFGPFGEHDYNPSWDAAQALADRYDTDAHLLPVTYVAAAQFAGAHLRAVKDDLVFVHFGLASERSTIGFERRATNKRDQRRDERERRLDLAPPERQPLIDENREQRFSNLDVASLVADFNDRRPSTIAQASVSEDCGAFVCNALLYHSLCACHKAKARGVRADAIFVHIPPVDADGARQIGGLVADILSPADVVA